MLHGTVYRVWVVPALAGRTVCEIENLDHGDMLEEKLDLFRLDPLICLLLKDLVSWDFRFLVYTYLCVSSGRDSVFIAKVGRWLTARHSIRQSMRRPLPTLLFIQNDQEWGQNALLGQAQGLASTSWLYHYVEQKRDLDQLLPLYLSWMRLYHFLEKSARPFHDVLLANGQ